MGVGERGGKRRESLGGVRGIWCLGKGRELGVQTSNAFQFVKLQYTWSIVLTSTTDPEDRPSTRLISVFSSCFSEALGSS
jgi:hypothetical protein